MGLAGYRGYFCSKSRYVDEVGVSDQLGIGWVVAWELRGGSRVQPVAVLGNFVCVEAMFVARNVKVVGLYARCLSPALYPRNLRIEADSVSWQVSQRAQDIFQIKIQSFGSILCHIELQSHIAMP